MFLHMLSPEQQLVFCQAAAMLISSDGHFDRREASYFMAARREMNMADANIEGVSLDEVLSSLAIFEKPVHRNVFLLELVGVAMADADFADEEQDVLEAVCKKFEVSTEKLERYREFAMNLRHLRDEGYMLLSLE